MIPPAEPVAAEPTPLPLHQLLDARMALHARVVESRRELDEMKTSLHRLDVQAYRELDRLRRDAGIEVVYHRGAAFATDRGCLRVQPAAQAHSLPDAVGCPDTWSEADRVGLGPVPIEARTPMEMAIIAQNRTLDALGPAPIEALESVERAFAPDGREIDRRFLAEEP